MLTTSIRPSPMRQIVSNREQYVIGAEPAPGRARQRPVGTVVEDGALVEPRARLRSQPHGQQSEGAEDERREGDAPNRSSSMRPRLRRSDKLSNGHRPPALSPRRAGRPQWGCRASRWTAGSTFALRPRVRHAQRRLLGLIGRQPAGSLVGGVRHRRHATRPSQCPNRARLAGLPMPAVITLQDADEADEQRQQLRSPRPQRGESPTLKGRPDR